MTILVVQSRLDSSRLPGKALLPLGGEPVLAAVLRSMKKVHADRYIVATDRASVFSLAPIAEKWGFECFEGPKDDVLERFCLVTEKTGADRVIRATGDNPFLFYEAASALCAEFSARNSGAADNPSVLCDYITWTGLPHGSGVEMFSAAALLKARGMTRLPYDHEHVGPALYNHSGWFSCTMLEAPSEWKAPLYRTTIDTPADYERARRLVSIMTQEGFSVHGKELSAGAVSCAASGTGIHPPAADGIPADKPRMGFPFPADSILEACRRLKYPVLCVPSAVQGKGTGHVRRCVSIAAALGGDIYIPGTATLENTQLLTSCLDDVQIKNTLGKPGFYSLILADKFAMNQEEARLFCSLAPLAAVDEGGPVQEYCDYLLDIIPACSRSRKSNLDEPGFIPLPVHRKTERPSALRRALVVMGGEDPSGLTGAAAEIFAGLGYEVTAVSPSKTAESVLAVSSGTEFSAAERSGTVRLSAPISGLREKLAFWDIVITHYGFTAFEAAAAGCAVLLLGTTPLHTALSRNMNFAVIPAEELSSAAVSAALNVPSLLFPEIRFLSAQNENLASFIYKLAAGRRIPCPLCGPSETNLSDPVAARYPDRTVRRCRRCGILYLAWSSVPEQAYGREYFFEDYKKQYGKTYLEDFHDIRKKGRARLRNINRCRRRFAVISPSGNGINASGIKPSLLDIGCAYGPFLSAAHDSGWEPYGIDISEDAVRYVTDTLHFSAAVADFPDFDPASFFGQDAFDAVTLWYVIEHFPSLGPVLEKIASILKPGGLLAFATPSASGVSGRFSAESFFRISPHDHFTLWEPQKAAKILRNHGFALVSLKSTGHHPERFPVPEKLKKFYGRRVVRSCLNMASRMFRLGDTFEACCIRL